MPTTNDTDELRARYRAALHRARAERPWSDPSPAIRVAAFRLAEARFLAGVRASRVPGRGPLRLGEGVRVVRPHLVPTPDEWALAAEVVADRLARVAA